MTTIDPERWLAQTVAVCRVPDCRVLRISGDDALSWLNGITTQDLRQSAPGTARLALLTDVRGRVRADAVIFEEPQALDVLIPAAGADELLASLEEHVIMEDVELSLPDMITFTAQGPAAAELSAAARGRAHDRLGTGGFDLLCPAAEADGIEQTLLREAESVGGGALDQASWARVHVLRGRPRFGVDFGHDTYPQEAGLETSHVCFDKGCYVGQEAVHMLEVRGKPPRRLVRLALESGQELEAGAAVLDANGGRVGQVSSWTRAPGGGVVALAMLRRAAAEADDALTVEGAAATRVGYAGATA